MQVRFKLRGAFNFLEKEGGWNWRISCRLRWVQVFTAVQPSAAIDFTS